jgi:EmrB/QacA subfamily drug resistance transporter
MSAPPASDRRRRALALTITGAAVFMVTLDNLVVTNALPSIRADLGASISQLGWFVNAYTLTFAALLLTGASLGDRFGRRRVFAAGLAVFTAGSLWAALAPSSGILIAARATQGLGAALVMPLSLTLLSAAFPAERRGLAIGIWSGTAGLAVALGPVVGGAVVDGLSWQWIFFLNVPIGIVLAPLAYRVLEESHGNDRTIDIPGLALASTGLFALVWGIVRGNDQGWTSPEIMAALGLGVAVLGAFVGWERRAPAPMLPLHLFRSRAFSVTNGVSLLMNFGIFGSIFLLAQFLQTVQGYSAFDAGVRTLPWTLMPMFIAPLAGAFSDRIGSRPLMGTGLALQAIALGWLATVSSPTVAYSSLVAPFVLAGIGMALVFAPVSNMILSSVRRSEEGKASGANNAIREVGGALGIAVLASVFSRQGSTLSGQGFVDGLVPAIWIGSGVLAAGALLALAVPGRRTRVAEFESESESEAADAPALTALLPELSAS